MPTIARLAARAATASAAGALFFAPAASADVTCTKVASPTGSDAANGSLATPYLTAQKLVNSLTAGDTGCLRDGNYTENLKITHGGTANARVTLTSFPGERAKVTGRFWVPKGSDFVTIANLDLDGSNEKAEPSPTLNANYSTFVDNDVTNRHTGICFLLGNSWGSTAHTEILHNRIHDCGKLPAANHDHGIYVEEASDTEIRDNLIYGNADRGVQLYPNAQRTHIAGNVIDGNGEGIIFSGLGDTASNDTVVEDNMLTNSNQRNNVESWYPAGTPIGTNNVVRDNCIAGGVRDDDGDGGIASSKGFTIASGNVVSKNPKYKDRGNKDFRVDADSPCAGIANGATGSSAARVNVSAPAPSSGSDDTKSSGSSRGNDTTSTSRAAVAVTTIKMRGNRIHLRGRLRRGTRRGLRAAAFLPRKAVIQIRWSGAWFPLRSMKVHGKRFSTSLRVPATMRGRVLKLRVTVPNVGSSRAVRVRAR